MTIKKPEKKKTKSQYMVEADRYFSLYIRARDGACVNCGKTSYLQCAHIRPRTYRSIRTNPDNAVALCRGCHVYYTHRPIEWEQFIAEFQPGLWEDLGAIALGAIADERKVDWEAEAAKWKSLVSV